MIVIFLLWLAVVKAYDYIGVCKSQDGALLFRTKQGLLRAIPDLKTAEILLRRNEVLSNVPVLEAVEQARLKLGAPAPSLATNNNPDDNIRIIIQRILLYNPPVYWLQTQMICGNGCINPTIAYVKGKMLTVYGCKLN